MASDKLVFFNDKWNNLYLKESTLLRSKLRDNFVEMHHIGSTAIKDIFAKPKLDIALVVKDLDKSKELKEIGYQYRGCLNIPFRYFFSKRTEAIDVNLHVLLPEDPELEGFLVFRDFMNNHEDIRNEYSELKVKIKNLLSSSKNEHFLNEYTLAKNDFITKVLKLAGFKGYCMRLVSHYREGAFEKDIYPKFKEDDVRVVFYKGPEIIGYANGDRNNKSIRFFKVCENEEYFKNRFQKYLESLN